MTCTCCHRDLPVAEFYVRKNGRVNRQCRDCCIAKTRAYQQANRERVLQAKRDYYERTKPEHAERARRAREADPEFHRERARLYYRDHKAAYIERATAWNKAHPMYRRERQRRQRANVEGVAVERVDYTAILERDGACCYLCGGDVAPDDLTFDHVIPTSRGGAHTAENIRVAHGRCNSAKGTRIPSTRTRKREKEAAA